jgi:cell filamentation protein
LGEDPCVDPVTGLLRNRLGITDAAQLAAAEAAYTRQRIYELGQRPIAGRFDLAHLQAVHRYISQDLVDWAGQLRTVNIAKTGTFCLVEHLESYAAQVFGQLAEANYLRGLGRHDSVTGLAGFYGDLNALHPFREFNGRSQRAFVSHLADRAGWHVAWERMSPQRNISASEASLNGDEAPLRALLDELVEPRSLA